MAATLSLADVVAKLQRRWGKPDPPAVTDPWEQIVLETASYLVDDERRLEVFERLRTRIGLAPQDIFIANLGLLVDAIHPGGMKPLMRAGKLRTASEEALELGAPLAEIVERPFDEASKVLRRFPGIGEPGAERIALFAGAHKRLGLDSNGLRVMLRLGFGKEDRNYTMAWRSVADAVGEEVARHDIAWVQRAHLLLRRHGQILCRRSAPLCSECPLAPSCPSAAAR